MPQTGKTPIQHYRTTTASAAPDPANLVDGEIALNQIDKKIFFKDNAGAVVDFKGNVTDDAQLKISSNLSDLNNTTTARTNIGLGNVDNTSDANKPVSTAQQTALNLKVDKITGKGLSTEDYTTSEKTKLGTLAEGSVTPTANKTPIAGADGTLDVGWLGGYIGIAYNIATDTFIRTGSGVGIPVGQFCGASASPLFSQLRRVALKDDGSVYKGISWLDFTKHDDGTNVALDGANGQIMVEYRPGYIRTDVVGDWFYLELSHVALPGFIKHPLFDGVEVAYQGTYEASLVPSDTKLSSIAKDPRDGTSPVYPVTTRAGDWGHASLTTAATDSLAEARGAGWQQADFWIKHWERCLLLVGWAGYNTQAMIGNGRTALSGGAWENDSYIGRCGLGDPASGYSGANNTSGTAGFLTAFSQVLGVENPYGDVWERVASLINDHAVYVKGLPPYDYASIAGWSRLTNHNNIGITLPTTNGYAGAPHSGLGIVLPADVTGSSTTKMADYFYQATGLRVFLVGGSASHGANAGSFCWRASTSATHTLAMIGGRLCFKKLAA